MLRAETFDNWFFKNKTFIYQLKDTFDRFSDIRELEDREETKGRNVSVIEFARTLYNSHFGIHNGRRISRVL